MRCGRITGSHLASAWARKILLERGIPSPCRRDAGQALSYTTVRKLARTTLSTGPTGNKTDVPPLNRTVFGWKFPKMIARVRFPLPAQTDRHNVSFFWALFGTGQLTSRSRERANSRLHTMLAHRAKSTPRPTAAPGTVRAQGLLACPWRGCERSGGFAGVRPGKQTCVCVRNRR
jgi:hypothetical protein